jgi:low affinity Fe/Cu permease
MKNIFRKISTVVASIAGSAPAFVGALVVVAVWASTGPLFDFSDTWQLVINTGTTIVTFLMVFLIQNTQNRDAKAMQLKLDELIRATKARNAFVDLEHLSDEELAQLDSDFQLLREKQSSSTVMKNLHASILTEHERRKQGSMSMQRLNDLLPLHKKKDSQ